MIPETTEIPKNRHKSGRITGGGAVESPYWAENR